MSTAPRETAETIVVEAVGVRFGRGTARAPFVDALADVDLRCLPGTILGVLGPNGSGKTTLLRVLTGDLRPDSGRAAILGRPAGDREVARRVGYQPEAPLPFPQLSAREFLHHFGALLGLPGPRLRHDATVLLERLDLADTGRRAVRTFSTGMQKRVALAAALLPDPDVLLLDEPTAGLDPLGSLLVLELLTTRAAAGGTVLLASHHLQEIEQICDGIVLLHRGRKVAEGTLDDLLGSGDDLLRLHGLDRGRREAVESAATAAGAAVVGWRHDRRHLFELFRELDER